MAEHYNLYWDLVKRVAVFAAKRKASTNCIAVNAIRIITTLLWYIGLAGLFTDSAIGQADRRSLSIACIHCSEHIGELRNTEVLLRTSSMQSRVRHIAYSGAKAWPTHLK